MQRVAKWPLEIANIVNRAASAAASIRRFGMRVGIVLVLSGGAGCPWPASAAAVNPPFVYATINGMPLKIPFDVAAPGFKLGGGEFSAEPPGKPISHLFVSLKNIEKEPRDPNTSLVSIDIFRGMAKAEDFWCRSRFSPDASEIGEEDGFTIYETYFGEPLYVGNSSQIFFGAPIAAIVQNREMIALKGKSLGRPFILNRAISEDLLVSIRSTTLAIPINELPQVAADIERVIRSWMSDSDLAGVDQLTEECPGGGCELSFHVSECPSDRSVNRPSYCGGMPDVYI